MFLSIWNRFLSGFLHSLRYHIRILKNKTNESLATYLNSAWMFQFQKWIYCNHKIFLITPQRNRWKNSSKCWGQLACLKSSHWIFDKIFPEYQKSAKITTRFIDLHRSPKKILISILGIKLLRWKMLTMSPTKHFSPTIIPEQDHI